MGQFFGGRGEADAQAFGFADPALLLGLGDALGEVVADLFEPAALGGVDPQDRTADALLTELTHGWGRSEPLRSGSVGSLPA
ncbi:hypothetical protein [Nocardia abscessus]|uniref:hypothetical protein n=1 Tax=Nocardia abscessus TaxID=120957 RepID=UPI002453E275|nr:hypothetical protein [Nocardia abscessus]